MSLYRVMMWKTIRRTHQNSKKVAKGRLQLPLPYDESQKWREPMMRPAPDFYLFDDSMKLVYRGQLDDSRPGNGKPLTGKDLTDAMDALLAGAKINEDKNQVLGAT